jgi:4-aminobutyrate aminotransferase/(S)-3-amino-2-methylpropionate transaminase
VACAAAVAAIEWMRRNDANGLANNIEITLKKHLEEIKSKYSQVAEIRGMGAMVAIEFVDPNSGRAMSDEVAKIAATCHKAGVVVLTSGMQGNVIRFLPPISIPKELLERGLGILASVIDEVLAKAND